MKLLKLTTIWSIGVKILISASCFWLIETLYFLIKYGWHLNPINESEIICDNIFHYLARLGYLLMVIVIISVTDKLLKYNTNL